MPEDKIQERNEASIERGMLLFYFIYSLVIFIVTIRTSWPIWLSVFTAISWLFCLALHLLKPQTFSFRAYATTSLMQISLVLWSFCTESLSLTLPLLLIFTVILVFYGIPEIIYVPVIISIFLSAYHLLIAETVDLSSKREGAEAVLQIISVFFIEYIIYFFNKRRMDNAEEQRQIILSLKEAERGKDDFLANVSHEIRTPINTICGISEILLREDLEAQVRSDLFSIQTAGRILQSIVSDVLDFTEMQSGKMDLIEENYNIASTINDIINMSMARKNESLIDLVVDCDANMPSGLCGDEQKIRRVIMNLVSNALKFTEEGCVSISISSRKTEYGINLIVSVKDTGIGMKKESLEKLFTNFNQVDTKRNRQKEGIGLGLAISQIMVDMMGGFITVDSEFGKGTEIQFVVPQKVTDSTPIAAVEDQDGVNVAIYVDMEKYDRPEVQEAYSHVIYHMVTQLGVKCHVCQNLPELKRRAERETFTHIFVSVEEYEEDKRFFDDMSQTTNVIAIIERYNESRITNSAIRRIYKPFYIVPIVMVLNDEETIQKVGVEYFHQSKFVAPEANILIVDDNLMNIRVLEGLLDPYQIQVDIATSGAEALEKIESMKYDVVFMDHMMPEMDGIETLQRIRQKQGNYYKSVPVVAVTANAVGGMREVFLENDFQDFIAKPVEVSVMERVLKRILPQEKILPVHSTDFWEEVQKNREETRENSVETQEDMAYGQDGKTEKGNATQVQESEQVGTGAGQEAGKAKSGAEQRLTDLPADSFNEELGFQYCGGPENYIEIVRLIGSTGNDDKNNIEEFYESKDWTNYTTSVHALKSTMLSIGVEKLSGMAKELELAGKRGDEAYIFEHHEEVMAEYVRILEVIEKSKTIHP